MNNKIVIVALGAAIIGAVFWMLTAEKDTEVVKKVDGVTKVGFVYLTTPGDHGWTYAHEVGRQQVEKHFGNKVEKLR